MIYKSTYKSPLGDILIASDSENIIGLWFFEQKYFEASINEEMIRNDDLKVICDCKKWLDAYFKGLNPSIDKLSLKPTGNEFRQTVWSILLEIPYGKTMTYKEIAKEVSKRLKKETMSAQAVGGAVGHNPISIIIPCHRVIGTNGSLTGYAGGIEKKIFLLNLEKVNTDNLFKPQKGTAL